MALERQLVQTGFRFGVEEGTDPHHVPFGVLTRAENACWTKSGRIEKRAGVAALPTSIIGGGSISAGARIFARGTGICLSDGAQLYCYSDALSAWSNAGRHPEVGLEWQSIQDSVSGSKTYDVAYTSDGQLVRVWATGDATSLSGSGDVYYDIVDEATGAVIVAPTLLDTGASYRVRALASGTSWVVLWNKSGNLKARTSGGTTTLKTDAHTTITNMCLDACVIGTEFVVAYTLLAGGIRLVRYNFTPVEQTNAAVAGEASAFLEALSVGGASGETLYLVYFSQTTESFKFAAANPSTLAQTVAPTTVESQATKNPRHATIGVVRETSTTCLVAYSFYSVGGSGEPAGVMRTKSITNAGAITAGQTNYFIRLLSRPFYLNGRAYAAVGNWTLADTFTSNTNGIRGSEVMLVDATVAGGGSAGTPCRQVGKIEWLIGGVWAPGFVSQAVATSVATRVLLPSPILTGSISNFESWRQGVKLVSATAGASLPSDMWRASGIGQEAFLSAGVLTSFDGLEAVGYGWAHGPTLDPSNTTASAAGGAIATGSYIYNVTAERRSESGLLYRSPIGTPKTQSVPGAGAGSVTVAVVPCSLSLSLKESGFYPIYRTTVGGTILHRLTIEPTSTFLLNAAFASQPVTILDTKADSNIGGINVALATRPLMYTDGGELEDWQPPGCLTQTMHRGRMWLVLGDGRTLAFSKDYSSNPGVAPGFHPTMVLSSEDPLTAIASLDEKLIAFSESGISYVLGDGPAPNGQGSDLTGPNGIQSDVGCSNGRSVVSTKDGIYFQSSKGIHLLTRGLEVTWIGKPVQDVLTSFPNITSAVLVPKKSEIRFTCNNMAGSAGRTLVWNYVEKQWSVSVYVAGTAIADACLVDDVYTFVTPAGVVYQEQEGTWLDAETFFSMTLETAWVSAAGPLAYHSVREFNLQGLSSSNHDLKIEVAFDGDTSYAQSRTFLAGSAVTAVGPFEECNITVGTRRKCNHIRFRITDLTPTSPGSYPVGTGRGPSFDAMAIQVAQKQDFAVVPATKKG